MGQTPNILSDRYDNKDECLRNANIVKTFAGRFGIGQWSFIGPGSEEKVVSFPRINSPQGAWDHISEDTVTEIRRKWTSHFPCNDPIVQRKVEK